ncbi:MAG: potassium channel family protein [Bacteroidota bacterium]|jgi:voltage-gated potassium channel
MSSLEKFSFNATRKAFLMVVGIVLFGISGFILIEDYSLLEAIYMTIITMSTVGFAEVKPLSDAGRVFTIFLILSSLSVFTYFLTLISKYILDGDFINQYRKYKMQQKISTLTNHVIICGFGRNGKEAATVLTNSGVSVIVIEEKSNKTDLHDSKIIVVEGDATKDELLIQCNIAKAKSLITTLPNDADNVYVVLAARELNSKINIISRASNDVSVKKLKTAGANNIIMPDKLGGVQMATLVLSPDIKELLDIMSIQNNEEFSIKEYIVTRELNLAELNIRRKTGSTILAIKNKKQDYVLNPILDAPVFPGEKIIAMGNIKQLFDLGELIK